AYASDAAAEGELAPAEPLLNGPLSGSSGRSHHEDSADADRRLAQAAAPAPPTTEAGPAAPSGNAARAPGPAPTATDAVAGPLLIYTARLSVAVFEASKSIDAVEALARQAGGYLVIRDDTTITVRVPASRYDEVLAKVTAIGDVLTRNVEVRDVTDEYYDLETRLRNQEVVLRRLHELLLRANSVEDALKVEAELARVATEVEQLKGRLKLLRELVMYSTITVTFASTATESVGSRVDLPFPWLGSLGLSNLLSL
ncbi:MAG TPA: DUF4349 domain-containing protein, partial [Polyangiaceae bacterium]|nr:DUF4349 domain-containing protein [Polyangiaceae bacterium]